MYGHTNVSKSFKFDDDDFKLGIWVNNQRSYYKARNEQGASHIRASITDQRIDLLNSVGFVWNVKKDGWEKHFVSFDLTKYLLTQTRHPYN